ncbi:S41 family peptidase [Treponema sp.]|uniref:S41 family peptidase n=1 Tax=Treponema sp. TaxID=166 RepID=UPI0025808CF0|nr:S41 family peptidase [Treponema sp.]
MKKNIIISIFLLFLFFCFAKENRILISSEPVEYKNIILSQSGKQKSIISYQEMLEDLDSLIYFIKTAYIGYDDLLKNGFDEKQFKLYFEELYKNQKEINSYNLFNSFANYLRPFPEDVHFSIFTSQSGNGAELFRGSKIYFSDIFIRKAENNFFVAESNESFVKKGSVFTGNEENLFYYPSKGEDIYRLGVFSKEKIQKAVFLFEGKSVEVSVSDDKEFLMQNLIKYHEIETENSGYASLSSFLFPDNDSPYRRGADIVFEKFVNLGIKWRNKKNIIIDLRSNLGGRIYIGNAFIYSFICQKKHLDLEKDEKAIDKWKEITLSGELELESPAYLQNKLYYIENLGETNAYYYKQYKKKLKEQKKNPQIKIFKNERYNFDKITTDFNGNLIILVDNHSASASEELVFLAKKIMGNDTVKIIGENTFGCDTYVDVLFYFLPNSHLSIKLGAQKNIAVSTLPEWHGEGLGIFPDYWSKGEDLNETIFFVTQDEEMKKKLFDIENRLM